MLDETDEPLVDTTAVLPLRSKKLDRLQRRKEGKAHQMALRTGSSSLLDLPAELLLQIFALLRPSDLLALQAVNRAVYAFVQEHERLIGKEIIDARYPILCRCFPLPKALADVDSSAHPALQDERRQDMLAIHKKPYQHVPAIDPLRLCTCVTCLLAWNNLCLVVDYAYWQSNLEARKPIPMIARGSQPEWNQRLLERNAAVVLRAQGSPLAYAAVLQKHLASTNDTILRRSCWTRKPAEIEGRPYHLLETEAAAQTDRYLEREGPPSYEFPFHRDNYYNIEAYMPNRRWSAEEQGWLYHHITQHDRDVQWTMARFNRTQWYANVAKVEAERRGQSDSTAHQSLPLSTKKISLANSWADSWAN